MSSFVVLGPILSFFSRLYRVKWLAGKGR